MSKPPARPKIYHITHVANLRAIVDEGALVSDRAMIERGGPKKSIGMPDIKRRRVEEIEVRCHAGTKVGDYVPFYFCPRSVMLYVIDRRNSSDLDYRDGQGPIVHLEADMRKVVDWAVKRDRAWAFSLSNAGSYYVKFRKRLDQLDQLDWPAIEARDWSAVKENKQAEFLLHESFPFELVERIGVQSSATSARVTRALEASPYEPQVAILPEWYY